MKRKKSSFEGTLKKEIVFGKYEPKANTVFTYEGSNPLYIFEAWLANHPRPLFVNLAASLIASSIWIYLCLLIARLLNLI